MKKELADYLNGETEKLKAEQRKTCSFKAEVIADGSGKWTSNSLVFATEQEAKDYVQDLFSRWTLVRDTRVVSSSDAVNYSFHGQLKAV